MTTSQIKKSLEHLGISNPMNKWLKLTQISTIRLAQDGNLFLDNDTELYYFDTASEIMYCTYGDFHNYSKTETSASDHKHYRMYPFDMVAGFICSTVAGPYGSYYTRNFTR